MFNLYEEIKCNIALLCYFFLTRTQYIKQNKDMQKKVSGFFWKYLILFIQVFNTAVAIKVIFTSISNQWFTLGHLKLPR